MHRIGGGGGGGGGGGHTAILSGYNTPPKNGSENTERVMI